MAEKRTAHSSEMENGHFSVGFYRFILKYVDGRRGGAPAAVKKKKKLCDMLLAPIQPDKPNFV